jgi:NADP-dependent 3-hydroxy acid dehydrogenase YdfG
MSPAVVITGASSGIGHACALELDRRGFRVFAGGRRAEDAERLRGEASAELTPLLVDVTDADSIAQARRLVADDVGDSGLQGLVNNAGVSASGPIEFLDVDELRRHLEVNLGLSYGESMVAAQGGGSWNSTTRTR